MGAPSLRHRANVQGPGVAADRQVGKADEVELQFQVVVSSELSLVRTADVLSEELQAPTCGPGTRYCRLGEPREHRRKPRGHAPEHPARWDLYGSPGERLRRRREIRDQADAVNLTGINIPYRLDHDRRWKRVHRVVLDRRDRLDRPGAHRNGELVDYRATQGDHLYRTERRHVLRCCLRPSPAEH